MTQAFKDFWINWNNYNTITSRKEFWLTVLDWFIILTIFISGLLYLLMTNSLDFTKLYWFIQIASIIIWFPVLAILWRRLNDLGFTFKTTNKIIWAWIILAILTFIPGFNYLYDLFNLALLALCAFPQGYFSGN